MATHAMWIHGTSVQPEWVHDNLLQVHSNKWDGSSGDVSWSDVNGSPHGWGTTYRGKRAFTAGPGGAATTGPFDAANPFQFTQKGYWFHFAIPTPVIISDVRSKLAKVFVWVDISQSVQIWAVHLYDGPNRIFTLPASEEWSQSKGRLFVFTLPSAYTVSWSIGVSVAAAFLADGDITFFSAGADFIT